MWRLLAGAEDPEQLKVHLFFGSILGLGFRVWGFRV